MTFRAYIVEDSSTIRDNLIDTLKELAQFEPVGTTGSEHEARRWLAGNAWDLAIIDLFLHEGSGMNVLEACRVRQPGQKIVVLSNHSSRDVRWRCLQLGADAVFDKSTELEALVGYCDALRQQNTREAQEADGGVRSAHRHPTEAGAADGGVRSAHRHPTEAGTGAAAQA